MIIDEQRGFSFIHIPKNSGTYISSRLKNTPTAEIQRGIGYEHLTLEEIWRLHPKVLNRLKTLSNFALIRDPAHRFQSSVSQYLSHFKPELFLLPVSSRRAARLIDDLMKQISDVGRSEDYPAELVHFKKQVDYVFFRGEMIVDNLFLASQPENLLQQLSSRFGAEIKSAEQAKSNSSKDTPPNFALSNRSETIAWARRASPQVVVRTWETTLNRRKQTWLQQIDQSLAPRYDDILDIYQADMSLFSSIANSD